MEDAQINYQLPINIEFTAEETIKIQAILSNFKKDAETKEDAYWKPYIKFAEDIIKRLDKAQHDAILHRLHKEYTENYKDEG